MLRQIPLFKKLIVLLSVISIASCKKEFDPPPVNVAPPGTNSKISYNFDGTDVLCDGLPNATAGQFTTEPLFWIVGVNLDLNADPLADPLSVYDYRIDFMLDNVDDISNHIGDTIPLEDDVADPSTDIHINVASINTTVPLEFYEFTEITFVITNVHNSQVSATFSGKVQEAFGNQTKNITNGKVVDVYYGVEQP